MRTKKKNTYRNILIPFASVATVIIIWQIVAVYVVGNTFKLPSFTEVVAAFITDMFGPRGTLPEDIVVSLSLCNRHGSSTHRRYPDRSLHGLVP